MKKHKFSILGILCIILLLFVFDMSISVWGKGVFLVGMLVSGIVRLKSVLTEKANMDKSVRLYNIVLTVILMVVYVLAFVGGIVFGNHTIMRFGIFIILILGLLRELFVNLFVKRGE